MKYGFIGCGNMGGAIARAVCKAAGAENVLLANRTPSKAEKLAKELDCYVGTNEQAAKCDFIFLGVKPQMMEQMLSELRPVLAKEKILVTMAAGLTIETIRKMAGGNYPVIRIMPNTPASIGAGMIQYCCADVSPEMENRFLQAMALTGKLDKLDEKLIDAASCVSGCGPAWAYMFVEAVADGGVACGLPRVKAQEYAAQMLLGAASLVMESGKHPGLLKDEVCSPGGSTIQGVRALEEHGFRGAVADAVIAAYEKTREIAKS
ncbi:MAG: pyrroline-5-carboxylate reductase [Oscillospiraceae bacterium]|nr:pyrroline-5-carboxylate reductase [Oscillospiraceae bacterium]